MLELVELFTGVWIHNIDEAELVVIDAFGHQAAFVHELEGLGEIEDVDLDVMSVILL